MEVCVESVSSAIHAEKGGAKRLELCANLAEGGTTPSIGTLLVVKQVVKIPVFVMIRPRGGDFYYSDQEFEIMKIDIKLMKQYGAEGIVLGMLHRDGTVDIKRCQDLVNYSRPLPVTFHRAIDMCRNIELAFETVISLGCERVLTSGGENTAVEGIPVIRKMVEQADGRIIVMPGGGLTERNLRRVLEETGALEFHASARVSQDSQMEYRNTAVSMGAAFSPPEFSAKVTCTDRVKSMIHILEDAS